MVESSEHNSRVIAFVLRLGQELHRYGTPSHRLEATLASVCLHLKTIGQFFATPTAIFASFGPQENQRTSLIRVTPGDVDLEKMTLLDGVVDRLVRNELTVEDGLKEVNSIADGPPRYSTWLTILCFGLASGCAGRFFGGGFLELAAATVMGFLTGSLAMLALKHAAVARVFAPVAAFAVSALAMLGAWIWPAMSAYVATVAGLIILIPGLTLTIAMSELASGHLASGTARLTGAIVLFLQIGFGVALGNRLGSLLPGVDPLVTPAALPTWTEWVALLVAPLCFVVLFRARPAQVAVILPAGILAYAGAKYGSILASPELGVFLGAFLVAMAGNIYRRLRDHPASVPIVPGIMLLVPGSIGFRSLSSLLARDVLSGVEAAFTMVLIAVALVAGLLLANILLPSRKAL
ncbi:MAG: threonine/serine exporter family protein [Acidobacteria bacterium]|uniref:Threonine/serine exporter family protein n=1 Tax=Candidatus Polarisedimenticola svalbardensis TaxID=2886004 RepID=A0A8J7C327_9BACT|nr:threonine/serine exporter family protein [Candidatus Polarisedimenticola svalbardensis]